MVGRLRFGFLGLLVILLSAHSLIFAADGDGAFPFPEQIRRPQRGEAPRYPQDTVIGELGPGSAPEEAYRFGRALLSALMNNNRDSVYLGPLSAARLKELTDLLAQVRPTRIRLGGGREEGDGTTSFLFRFLGREKGIAGELYLRQENAAWILDDLIIEDPQNIAGRGDPYPYNFSPYERFF